MAQAVGKRPIRVALIDDQSMVLAGIAMLIERDPDVEVAGTAENVGDGNALIRDQAPDVVVCDIQLGTESGFSLLKEFPDRRPPFVLLSAWEQPAYQSAARTLGAAGYVSKGRTADSLLEAIRCAAAGGTYFDIEAVDQDSRPAAPSARELQVIHLLAEGMANDDIARALGISVKTVGSHLGVLFDRYSVSSRTELAMYALGEGWIRSIGPTMQRDRETGRRWMSEPGVLSPSDPD